MRILFFTDYYRPEPPPPAHHIAERAALWQAAGHPVTVVTNHPNYPEGKLYPGFRNRLRSIEVATNGVRVVRVWTVIADHRARFMKLADHASFALSSVIQSLREPKPDVVIATSPHLMAGLAGVLYARLVRRPMLLEVRDLWPDSVLRHGTFAYRVFKRIERYIYRHASAVSVLTPAFERHVLDEGAQRAVTIVGGVDLARFMPGDPPEMRRKDLGLENTFVVGYPGTLGTAHDTSLLLEAARQLTGTRVRFLLIGGGPFMHDLESQAKRLCPGMIRFVPTQPTESMPSWWRTMDAGLVLLKKTEALRTVIPSKMFECMATQKPIVFVGPRGAGSDVVESCRCGVIVDGDGPDHLVNCLSTLASDSAHYKQLASNALSASTRFSRSRQAQDTLDVLSSVISSYQS
jgi:glycosyltransferase involved in cell wall biosynthesis